ncbi:MAG: UDP-N-acetylmuramoyl-L-alanine--D-glutamate ligase [Desulfobacterales bacterium]|jgi:UDP-N-acetylmuramoylalanine--D-glutamate ligase|nr:UDP-N-acetylmuramoyl-L-alanine--D-glutamate ligase [Desulfobacterales bacterium]
MNDASNITGSPAPYGIAGRRVLVVGLGLSGASAAKMLVEKGAAVTVTDAVERPAAADRMAALTALGVQFELGGHSARSFDTADLIVVSPGVPETIAPIAAARHRGICVIGEVELAAALISAPILAVTGTNGKTTTTTLLGHMLQTAGLRVFVGGNIGRPLIECVSEPDRLDVVVAEISSFQLDTTRSFRPKVSVLLNVTADHLDRYSDFDAYAASKGRIFENQQAGDTAVVNGSDAVAVKVSEGIRSRRWLYNVSSPISDGAMFQEDALVLQTPDHRGQQIDLSGLRLKGRHNRENAAAAALAALAFGVSPVNIEKALSTFEGLAHRVESVGTIGGVEFVNDSKGTNVDAVVRALESFDRPVVLIMGGRDKAGVFDVLCDPVRRQVRCLVLIGEATEIIRRALGSCAPTRTANDMDDAVAQAFSASEPGDVVLLSPGCASFDMYTSYKHRGESFRSAVKKLEG